VISAALISSDSNVGGERSMTDCFPRPFTAPAGIRLGVSEPTAGTGAQSTGVSSAIESFKYPPNSIEHPDYWTYYANEARQPAMRVGLPPPKYWSKFAGRVPPSTVLKRLHRDGARSRLLHRFAVDASEDVAAEFRVGVHGSLCPDTGPTPDELVAATESDHALLAAVNRRLGSKRRSIYESVAEDLSEPATQPATQPSSSRASAASSPERKHRSHTDAASAIQRAFNRFSVAKGAQRALGVLHMAVTLGVPDVFGTSFLDNRSLAVDEQLTAEARLHCCAVAIEYECRLHSENYARLVLSRDDSASQSPVPRAAVLPDDELPDVVRGAVSDSIVDARKCGGLEQVFGGTRELDVVMSVLEALHRLEPMTAEGPSELLPLGRLAVSRRVYPRNPRHAAARRSTVSETIERQRIAVTEAFRRGDRGFTLAAPDDRPLDDEELRLQHEMGIPADEPPPTPPISMAPAAARPSSPRASDIFIPRGCLVSSQRTVTDADIWGGSFEEAGGFVDLDDLRRHGGRGAAILRPRTHSTSGKPSAASAGECVVCELDATDTIACVCGNPVHVDCGDRDAAGRVRCCQRCARDNWTQ
jgi:hypothetical protein